jgi:P4 family phage/plasmid primase-like protien
MSTLRQLAEAQLDVELQGFMALHDEPVWALASFSFDDAEPFPCVPCPSSPTMANLYRDQDWSAFAVCRSVIADDQRRSRSSAREPNYCGYMLRLVNRSYVAGLEAVVVEGLVPGKEPAWWPDFLSRTGLGATYHERTPDGCGEVFLARTEFAYPKYSTRTRDGITISIILEQAILITGKRSPAAPDVVVEFNCGRLVDQLNRFIEAAEEDNRPPDAPEPWATDDGGEHRAPPEEMATGRALEAPVEESAARDPPIAQGGFSDSTIDQVVTKPYAAVAAAAERISLSEEEAPQPEAPQSVPTPEAPLAGHLPGARRKGAHVWGTRLVQSELEMLAASWIDQELAGAAGLRHVDSSLGGFMFGQRDPDADFSGIVIPNYLPGDESPRDYRLRLNHPPQERQEDGTIKPRYRYRSAPGAKNRFYFPPAVPAEWLQDSTLPIILIEGEKKTLALWRLAWHSLGDPAERPRYLPIGLHGAWNWRGIEKPLDGRGERYKVGDIIADFALVRWANRIVTILFDSNIATNEMVRQSRKMLATTLRKRKARVLYADISPHLKVNGIDDVAGQLGPEKALEIVNSAYDPKTKPFTKPPTKELPAGYYPTDLPVPQFDQQSGSLIGPIPAIGDTLLVTQRFASNEGEKLHIFVNGAYRDHGLAVVRETGQRLLQQWGVDKQWSRNLAGEIHEWVFLKSNKLWERPPLDRICLLNGIYNLQSCQLGPHSPEAWLSPIQLPVIYDPVADCPEWDRFLEAVLPTDAYESEVTFQLIALLMIPYTAAQKALLLQGPRGTGKSRFLFAIQSFLGASNVCSKSLHALEENRFTTAYLYGKLVNICADLPARHLETTSVFKAITGEDYIDAEYKGGKQFQFRPFARLLFSANLPPQSQDTSDAFIERWWVIPFNERFQDSAKRIPAEILDRKLAQPGELSGVLNRALRLLPQVLRQQGIGQTQTMHEAHDDFTAATDPFRVWLNECILHDCDSLAVCEEVRKSYYQFRRNRDLQPISDTHFGLEWRRYVKGYESVQRTVHGVLKWCYVGIRLITPEIKQR